MQRLTKTIKEKIIANMHRKLFKTRFAAIDKQKVELADAVYYSTHTEDEHDFMQNAPQGAFSYSAAINIKFSAYSVSMPLSRAFPFFAMRYGTTIRIGDDDALYKRYTDINYQSSLISSDKRRLTTSTEAILNSVTTIKKLLEVWPEVTEYLPDSDVTQNLPALPIGDLKDLILELQREV